MKVLFIDDEINILNAYKRVFKNEKDLIFHTAESGMEAIEMFKNNNYDMIFTDYNLPLMNGVEIAEKFKSINNETKLFLITGQQIPDQKKYFFEKILIKPVSISILQETIRNNK